MSGTTASVSSLLDKTPSTDAYTARASVAGNGSSVDSSTSQVTGSRTGGNWSDGKTKGSSKSDFLMLLITQLKNQDPLSPMDNAAFMQQLTTLQQVDSVNNMQRSIEEMSTSFKGSVDAQKGSAESMSNSSAVSLIGKEVRLRQKSIAFDGATPVGIGIQLGNSKSATIEIRNDKDEVVRTLATGTKDSENSSPIVWDGSTDAGTPAAQGDYSIHIQGQETNTSLYAFTQAVVEGVRFTDKGALIKLGGKELPIKDIMDVSSTAPSTSTFGNLSADSALSMLGKTVRLSQPFVKTTAKDGQNIQVRVNGYQNLPATAKIQIVDANGSVVDELERPSANGDGTTSWDGRMLGGQDFAPEGTYAVQISGADYNPSLYTYEEGKVESVTSAGGATQVKVNGQYYPLTQLLEVVSAGGSV